MSFNYMKHLACCFLLILISFACTDPNGKTKQELVKRDIPKFNADLAYAHIEKQINFGPRQMNSSAHDLCRDWLASQLKTSGFQVDIQHFEAKAYNDTLLRGSNIIATYKAGVQERVLLCAHYDTRHIADKDELKQNEPIDGADDGASGVAVLLEIARLIQLQDIPMGVDIIFFDAEDYGSDQPGNDYSWGLGSQYWAKHLENKDDEYKYGILLDMVGSKNASFRKEGFSMQSAKTQVDQIWELAKRMGHQKYFINERTGHVTDDHRFIIEKTKIPMLDIINVKSNGKFMACHHKHCDDISVIDKATLQSVGQVVTAQIIRESNMENQ